MDENRPALDGVCEQAHHMKMPKQKEKANQHAEFVKAARELGTDESEEAFDKILKKVASAPAPKSVQKRKGVRRKTR